MADLFGITNIPQSVWIDEHGMVVRPAETAPAPPQPSDTGRPRVEMPSELPQRFVEILTEAAKIKNDADEYHAALRDWVDNGAQSRFAMAPETVVDRSRP